LRILPGQREKDPRLVHGEGERVKPAVEGNQIEQVAMLLRCGVGPVAGSAGAMIGPVQPHEQAAARLVLHIADDPVIARTAANRQVMAAHRLGIAGQMP